MQDEKNTTLFDFCKIFYKALQFTVKSKMGQYGPGKIRVRQTGK